MDTQERVIAVPGVDLMKKTVDIGNCNGADRDKFKEFNLDSLNAEKVKAPLIKQCLANIECKVINVDLSKKYKKQTFPTTLRNRLRRPIQFYLVIALSLS